jgi:hypothetical protein
VASKTKPKAVRAVDVTPSARRLTDSLRDIGYDFVGALADIVDNSISAGARQVDVLVEFDGAASRVIIADDGYGMTERELSEALRFGSRREYESGDLGRYGLGLKTASISQCRRVTVVTRRSEVYKRIAALSLDLDHVSKTDRWEVIEPPVDSAAPRALEWLDENPGTVVLWENLDRILPERRPEGGWAKRRLDQLAARASEYLGMVFHRFIEGEAAGDRVVISVNGEKVRPWNPFAPGEEDRVSLTTKIFEVVLGRSHGLVTLKPYVLPPRDRFSSHGEFERMSGPLKWNRQQGLYIYRADRMIQSGGWCGIRAADEHTKLARASLDFHTDLDQVFQINVAKMRVHVPAEVRMQLEKSLHELCHQADAVYRRDAAHGRRSDDPETPVTQAKLALLPAQDVSAALMAAALEIGEYEALERILTHLHEQSPDLAASLGW